MTKAADISQPEKKPSQTHRMTPSATSSEKNGRVFNAESADSQAFTN